MKDKIKKDILSVLRKSIIAIKRKDIVSLRDQSNRTVHNSSIFQDKYSISTAVVIYSIYKLIEKNKFRQYSGWDSFERLLLSELNGSVGKINRNDFKGYLVSLRKITQGMTKLDNNIGSFIDHVIHVTKIKKATRMPTMSLLGLKVERQILRIVKCFAKPTTERKGINNLNLLSQLINNQNHSQSI